MFGKESFMAGLQELGYTVEDRGETRLAFKYTIGDGRFKGTEISIGLEVPQDFNVTCPTGPHLSPRLIPLNGNGAGNDRAVESPNFGADWQYLSRPFGDQQSGWGRTNRTVKGYLRHIKRIVESL
jgi:hypothetical protein